MEFTENISSEQLPRPEKLYRGFVVDPEELSIEMFHKPLVMGQQNEDDLSKTTDGNEAGVYMSTNQSMVESSNYGNGSRSSLKVPRYASSNGFENIIHLPGCGVVVEVRTQDLDIRKPKISPVLQGHYNNGFIGDEWISDEVPTQNYRLLKLILSRGANDPDRFIIEVNGDSQAEIESAINEIKAHAAKSQEKAETFKRFLEGLTEAERYNRFLVDKKWIAFQDNK